MDEGVAAARAALKRRGCHVSDEWLTDCVNFFRSENNQFVPSELEKFVYDQWLLADLREIGGGGSFPANLSNTLKTVLHGRMACQIEYVTDIGHSAYTQYQKIRNEDVGNLEVQDSVKEYQQAWEPKSNRMLCLSLCDGKQTVKAIEYKPIPKLKCDIVPGSKAILLGPIQCRRGVMLLEDGRITTCGGEVDAVVVTNAYENILARKLNLPENPDPYKNTRASPELSTMPPPAPVPAPANTRPPVAAQRAVPNNVAPPRPKNLVQQQLSWAKPPVQPPQRLNNTVTQSSGGMNRFEQDFPDDDLMAALDPEIWEEGMEMNESTSSRNNVNRNASSRPYGNPTGSQNFTSSHVSDSGFDMGSDEDDMFLQAEAAFATSATSVPKKEKPADKKFTPASVSDRESWEKAALKRPATSFLPEEPALRRPLFSKQPLKQSSSQEVSSTSDNMVNQSWIDPDDLIIIEDSPDRPSSCEEFQFPVTVQSSPFIYLSQISDLDIKDIKTVRVKAAVITVVEKLSIVHDEWKLTAKISDGTTCLDVKFSSQVLEDIMEMSASTMRRLRAEMAKEPDKREVVKKKFERAQNRLVSLNCLLDLEISPETPMPLITGMQEISRSTVTDLKNRRVFT